MYEENRLPLKFYVYADFERECAGEDILEGRPFSDISVISEIDLPYGTLDYVLNVLNGEKSLYKLLVMDEKQLEETVNALVRLSLLTASIQEN